MHKKFYLTVFTFLLLSFSLNSQLSLVFPKNNYVFDQIAIEFSWNSFPDANTYELQVATDINFTTLVVHETSLTTTNTFPSGLTSNQKYYWRTKANNSIWSEIRTFRIVDFKTWPELEMWLNSDSVELIDGNRVAKWFDASGNGYDYIQYNAPYRPYIASNITRVNGHDMIEFLPSENTSFLTNNFSALTEGEIFSFMEINEYPAASDPSTGIWSFGTSANEHYPYTDGNVYTCFGRDERFNIGNLSSSFDLTRPHVLNISSSMSFDVNINNVGIFNTTDGLPSFTNGAYIGRSAGGYFFNGRMGEILLFNTVLNDSLRSLTHSYMRHKFAPPVNLGASVQYGVCEKTLDAGDHFISYLWS